MTPASTPIADWTLCLLATEAHSRLPLAAAVEAAIRGGVDVVQVREKDCDDAAFAARARSIAAVCRAHGVPLIINDRTGLVRTLDADGVHVGQGDAPVFEARAALPPGGVVGVSTHDDAELAAALEDGADYVGVGSVFATGTKGTTVEQIGPAEAARLCALAEAAGVPAFAIGGIAPVNVARLAEAGVRRAAVCAGILGGEDPEGAARTIRSALLTRRA